MLVRTSPLVRRHRLAGGLVERGGELGAAVERGQLLGVVVVEEGEEAERVLDGGEGEVGDEGEKRAEEMGREIEGIGLLALAACASGGLEGDEGYGRGRSQGSERG